MRIYAKSDKGLVRESNQDIVIYECLNDDFSWVLVCDGMGGQNSGDVASNLASKIIKDIIRNEYKEDLKEPLINELMLKCINSANIEIFNKSIGNEKYNGMGTTAVLVFIKSDNIYIAHVGDSRAYLVSDKVEQLTIDHSMVQEMINNGEITEDEAKVHPKKNVITRAIGVEPDVKIDFIKKNFIKDSSLLICTDGFSNYVDKEFILDYFSKFRGETLVDNLINYANNSGGNDNITVAVVTR